MSFQAFLENLSATDIILIGTAALFFSSLGVVAGILNRRSIVWSAIAALCLLGFFYRYELQYFWLTLTSTQ